MYDYNTTGISKLVENSRELFAGVEFEYTDYLLKELLGKLDTQAGEVVLVISLDESKPVYGLKDSLLFGRFNGRYFPPKHNKSGVEISLEVKDWQQKINTILKDKEVTVANDAAIPIKFTFYDKIIDLKK